MSRRRTGRRTRRRSGRGARLTWIGICVSALLVAMVVTPSASYSVTELGRQSGVEVVADETALVGLQTAASVEEGQESPMVTVVNNFGRTELRVTVELTPPSRSEGSLRVNGTDQGDAYQITLRPSEKQAIDVCFSADADGVPADATFNATFTATGTDLAGEIAPRTVPIVDDQTEATDC